jgi:hypothetical protein
MAAHLGSAFSLTFWTSGTVPSKAILPDTPPDPPVEAAGAAAGAAAAGFVSGAAFFSAGSSPPPQAKTLRVARATRARGLREVIARTP